ASPPLSRHWRGQCRSWAPFPTRACRYLRVTSASRAPEATCTRTPDMDLDPTPGKNLRADNRIAFSRSPLDRRPAHRECSRGELRHDDLLLSSRDYSTSAYDCHLPDT